MGQNVLARIRKNVIFDKLRIRISNFVFVDQVSHFRDAQIAWNDFYRG